MIDHSEPTKDKSSSSPPRLLGWSGVALVVLAWIFLASSTKKNFDERNDQREIAARSRGQRAGEGGHSSPEIVRLQRP